jgi:hypothetical protein
MTKLLKQKQLKICDQTTDPEWKLPQCGCDNDMHKHIVITDFADVGGEPENGPIVVEVMCFECFARSIIEGTIAVENFPAMNREADQ